MRQECSLHKFGVDTELGGVAETLDGYAAIQKDLDSLEKWDKSNLMKFNKGNLRCSTVSCLNFSCIF